MHHYHVISADHGHALSVINYIHAVISTIFPIW